ncbi:MAG: LamG domain-containing protein [Planctomycetes bacterium]|nr:LamG domain-containing protein [Planctomycetota bacterium]
MWNDTRPEWMKLAHALVDTVRAADPDRPLQADAEITWAGKLETISIHYPEGETGTTGRQFVNSGWVLPNDLAWLKHEGVNRSWRAEFAWDRPLMIGEYYAMDDFEPEHGSAYMGDEAFDQGRWRWATIGGRGCLLPHADNGGYQLNARISSDHYRAAGVACLNPWTGQGLDIIPPLLARPLDYFPNVFGGGELKRRFLVANDAGRAWNEMHLQAGLLVDGRTVWSEEKIPAHAGPGERREVAVAIRPPAVAAPTRARLVVRLRYGEWSGARELYRHEEDLWIMPRASLAGVDPAAVALVDGADGATAKALAGLGLKLTAGGAGDGELSGKRVLVVGEGAAGSADLAAAARFAEGGGQVLVLHQDACDPFIPGQPEIDPRHAASMSWRHARHPALDGLDDGQLRWWLPDHLVADHSLVRAAGGPALPASTSGGSFGMHWSPLTSVRHGKGQVTFCQYRLADRAALEPAAGWILAQALRHAAGAAPAAPAPALRLVGAVPKATREALAAASVAVSDGLDGDGPALVDARSAPDAAAIARLRAQLESGATVWLRGLDDKTLPAVAGLLPWTPGFAPLAKDAVAAARRSDHPLIAGIASADLYWARGGGSRRKSTAPLGGPAVVPPALDAAVVLTEPGLLVAVPVGKGTVLIDQLNWDGGLSAELERATRIAAGLARNCGAGFRIAAAKRYRYAHLDLSAGANRGYVDEVADDGKGGWTDQGANDMRYFLINHLGTAGEGGAAVAVAPFPTEVSLAGVPFRLVDPKANQGRAVVSLRGQGHGEKAPAEVRDLPAGGARANRVWFLHAAGWGPTGGYLTEVARYEVVYADGSRATVPVRWGRDISDWWDPKPLTGAQIAWSGRNEKHAPVGIYCMAWDNPSPDKAIAAIDVVGALAETQLVLLGATLGLEDEQGVRTAAAWECGTFADGKVLPGAGGQPLTGSGTPASLANRAGLRLAGGQALGARLGAGPLADGTPLAIEIEVAPEAKPGGFFGGLVEAGSYLQSGVRLMLRHDLKVVVEHFAGAGKEHATYLESREPLPLGRFSTVRYEHDGKRARLLIDGQPVAVADCPPPAPWRGDLRVGSAGGKDYFLNGVVAGVRLLALAPGK